ncbi:hypothetical protein ABB07_09620 [Streptomyces incarnatus]|uniref:DUF402 domain-containing protein n=1 Tax=Streptomyces incarnatus TaxID=665007 RepID=A0ABN4GEB9_9ACTN|nr:hypothetical protein ABB07_09620 [Streptomyces incarnatus]
MPDAAAVDRATGYFEPGAIVLRREILDGRPWLSYPVRVVADRPDLLAVYLARGTALAFGDGDFSWGPHPWQRIAGHWRSHGVLQLQRPGDAYAVWMFRDDTTGDFTGWYVNFQDPYRKNASGFDTLDHELDLWIPADGGPYRWKDVDEFEHRARSGGFTAEQSAAVRAEAARVADLLDSRATWWEQEWAQWEPAAGWLSPPAWTGAVR